MPDGPPRPALLAAGVALARAPLRQPPRASRTCVPRSASPTPASCRRSTGCAPDTPMAPTRSASPPARSAANGDDDVDLGLAGLWYDRARRTPAILSKFARSVELLLQEDDVILCSYLSKGRVGRNWGDKLNPVLVALISGKRVLNAHGYYNLFDIPIYAVIGSGLGFAKARGFDRLGARICPLRRATAGSATPDLRRPWPLVTSEDLGCGIAMSRRRGRSGPLAAALLRRERDETTSHRADSPFQPFWSVEFERLREQGAEIIDITGDLFDVVRAVKSCGMVASSSLHGLIIADAYGVPIEVVAGRGPSDRRRLLSSTTISDPSAELI